MYDPNTVAFELKIPLPWRRRRAGPFKGEMEWWWFLTIWHVDPEADGSDDSCGWFHPPLTAKEAKLAKDLVENPHDNLQHWFPDFDKESAISRIARIFEILRRFDRPWWKHPRWHFWHWRIQVHPIQDFKRWMWGRCAYCSRSFPWGYAPVSTQWGGGGPRWFKSEEKIYHHECYDARREYGNHLDRTEA